MAFIMVKVFKVRIFPLRSQSFSRVLPICCHRRDIKAFNCIINALLHLRIPRKIINYTTVQDCPVLASKDVPRGLQKGSRVTFLSRVIAQFRTYLSTSEEKLALLFSSTARPRIVQAFSGKKTIFQRNNNVVQHHLHI